MTTKAQVIDAHKKHPMFSAPEIADLLGCDPGYVRATAKRQGITLQKGKRRVSAFHLVQMHHERKVGRAALAAGLTLEKINEFAVRGSL